MIAVRHAEPSDIPTLVELMRDLGYPVDADTLGRISAIVVAPRVRRNGIGKRLLDAAITCFDSQECTLIEVTSGERRRDAHALYRAFGFAEKRSRFVKKLAG